MSSISSPRQLLRAGISAMHRKKYPEAVDILENFCRQQAETKSDDYFEAQRWLIKAYQKTNQIDLAIALTRHMMESQHTQTRNWAKSNLDWLLEESQMASGYDSKVPPSTRFGQITRSTEIENFIPIAGEFLDREVLTTEIQSLCGTNNSEKLLPVDAAAKLLKGGKKDLQLDLFGDAIVKLERFCRSVEPTHKHLLQAQMFLVKAYQETDQIDRAIALSRHLVTSESEKVKTWAQQVLDKLAPITDDVDTSANSGIDETGDNSISIAPTTSTSLTTSGRSSENWVKFSQRGATMANLTLASGVTVSLLLGMVFVLCLTFLPNIFQHQSPEILLGIAIGGTVFFNLLVFAIGPIVMDIIQRLLYRTRWTNLSEIEGLSPESAKVIREVCQQKQLREPELGIIEDDNPTAFTYGSFPNSARLVVSRGLFKYLDDDEIATVYAHELGHIVHWDFAVMTLASTLVQITYLIYIYSRRMLDRLGNSSVKQAAQNAALLAYIFYVSGEFLLLFLSRVREYHADRFAAEVTGNPNALSRALVKIAYGITEEKRKDPDRSNTLMRGMRAMGICDAQAVVAAASAYRVATKPRQIGRVFLWDMFNPWAWWMELMSTHPLTGKRIRALTNYAEQLGLATEYDFAAIVRKGKKLQKGRLYRTFITDLLLMFAPTIGWLIGFSLGILFAHAGGGWRVLVSMTLIGFGLGILLKMLVMHPDCDSAVEATTLTLMSDPYANPLRGRPVKLTGEIIGRNESGKKTGSDLVLQDATGKIALHYRSRFGWLGNIWFGWMQAESLIHQQVTIVGWFRRSIASRVDLVSLDCPELTYQLYSYHRFWTVAIGLGATIFGLSVPFLFPIV
jgi:Zn-dependent protease with chaperone function